ncbi:hypothetical protein [Bacillus sp. FJAT-28004]|uniref:hypothetical protein n=1 Tax=Bacillus sp. FJAT-28004 TaxID=1679165 RepID=UPI000B0FA6D3|nr:hypothetical protein [Bacillus sp. FJAT-28004]
MLVKTDLQRRCSCPIAIRSAGTRKPADSTVRRGGIQDSNDKSLFLDLLKQSDRVVYFDKITSTIS